MTSADLQRNLGLYQDEALKKLVATWLHGYNWHRPHMSLVGQPPIKRMDLKRNNLLRLHT